MSYLCLKTASAVTTLLVVDGDGHILAKDEWESGRDLARDLLKHIETLLGEARLDWSEVKGLGVFQGPGSFTSLRIGLTVANTISYSEQLPIVGAQGEKWLEQTIERLNAGENDEQVMPFYGADPHITAPRK